MNKRIDMSAFEAQFAADRYNPRIPNEIFEQLAFLNVRIDDIGEEKEIFSLAQDRLEIEQAILNHKIAELRAQIDELLRQRKPKDAELERTKAIVRHNDKVKDVFERERLRLLAELEAQERFLAKRDAIFSDVSTKPWAVGVNGKKALPHQWDGAHRLISAERGLLGDKPGLGKTLEAIMTVDMLRSEGKGQKVLIFTPKPVLPDFERAFSTWTDPTLVHVLNQTTKGIKAEILDMVQFIPEIIVITNYEVWRRDKSIHRKLIQCGFDTVIMDEAHVLKGWKSVTTQDIVEIIYAENKCPKCGHGNLIATVYNKMCAACEYVQEEFGEFCSVKNVYPMTGTPILNKPQELWPLLYMIDREAFPTEKAFLEDYCVKVYDYGREQYVWTFGPGGSERLLAKLGMRYTARTRETAGVEMPEQEIKHHWLELDPEKYPRQYQFVKDLRERARLAFSEKAQMTTDAVLAWYTRMRQAASWPDGIQIKGCAHVPSCWDEEKDEPGKCYNPTVIFPPPDAPPIGESVMMDEAESIISEAVEDGDRIVVFTFYKAVISELVKRCEAQNLRVGYIMGGVPESRRRELIDDFNANHTKVGEHKYDVLICQSGTSSVGLNLSGAHQSLIIEREWNPGKEEQMIDRVRRLDSKLETIVHILHCAGTATELIDAIQEQKKNLLDGFQADVDLAEAMRKFLEG